MNIFESDVFERPFMADFPAERNKVPQKDATDEPVDAVISAIEAGVFDLKPESTEALALRSLRLQRETGSEGVWGESAPKAVYGAQATDSAGNALAGVPVPLDIIEEE